MYKDDHITGGCNESLLRIMSEGRGNSCPVCENALSGDHTRPMGEGCNRSGWGIPGYPLALVYAPIQEFEDILDVENALRHGTVFKALILPFEGDKRVGKGGNCRG